jgi:hypothetical protein
MSPPTIPLDLAWSVADAFAARHGAQVIRPDSWQRKILVPVVAEVYALAGSKLTLADVRERVSITLPGEPGPALDLLKAIPYVGGLVYGLCSGLCKTTISPSPAGSATGNLLGCTMAHEGDHAEGIECNGLFSIVGYTIPEGRAGSEGVAYGQGVAARVWLLGEDPGVAGVEARTSLGFYALDEASEQLADDLVDVAVKTLLGDGPDRPGVVPGTAREIVQMLTAAGVVGLPALT